MLFGGNKLAIIISNVASLMALQCGSIIKKELGLRKERRAVFGNVPIVVIWDEQKIRKLCPKYGIDFNDLTSLNFKRAPCYLSIPKLTFRKSSGYFSALKNRGVPEKDKGEIGPTVING